MRLSDAKTTRTAGLGLASWWETPLRLGRWLLGRSPAGEEPDVPGRLHDRFRNVCISREAGAGAGLVGRLLGTRLGWRVYDNELLDTIAQGMEITVEEARTYDELAPGLVQDWLLPVREEHYAPQEAYLDHLAKLVQTIGRAGDSILVGRGAAFLLPKSETLSVRLIAPLSVRAQRLSERMGVSYRTARRAAHDLDRRYERFIRALHRVDANDPHQYDLVLDTQSLGISLCVEVIAHAVEVSRAGNEEGNGPGPPPPPTSWRSAEPKPEVGEGLP